MARVSTKKLMAEIKELETNGVDYPKETPEFDSLRNNIFKMLEEGTSYTSRRPSLRWIPEETIYNRGEEQVGGYFRYERVISVRLPAELGVDCADIVATYYLNPKKGLEEEINRVISSINSVENWSDKTIREIQLRELANQMITDHKKGE